MSLPYATASTLPWGSFVLTPSSGIASGVAFIAEDFDCTEPATVVDRTTELGAPNGAFMTAQARTARGTLQLAANTTLAPERGDEFSRVLRPNTTAVTFFFTEIGIPVKSRDFHTVQVTAREKI